MDKEYIVYDELYKKQTLEEYLNNLVGKRLFKEEQKLLIDKIDLKLNGHRKKSISCMNKAIEMYELNYEIISKTTKINNKSERYWMIVHKNN